MNDLSSRLPADISGAVHAIEDFFRVELESISVCGSTEEFVFVGGDVQHRLCKVTFERDWEACE